MNVNWVRSDKGIADLLGFGSDAASFIKQVKKITDFEKTLIAAQLNLKKVEQFLSATDLNPLVALAKIVLADAKSRIEDLRNTGVYLLPIGFSPPFKVNSLVARSNPASLTGLPGGVQGLKRFISTNLRNRRDPRSPNFGPSAYVGGFGAIGFGLDAQALLKLRGFLDAKTLGDLFRRIFLSDQMTERYLALEKWGRTLDPAKTFTDAFNLQRLLLTAVPAPDSPWSSLTLGGLLPDLNDLFVKLEGAMAGIVALLSINPLKQYFALLDAVIAQILALVQFIDAFIDFLNLLLTKFPGAFFSFGVGEDGVQIGGNEAVLASLDDWFDPVKHPQVADIPATSATVGVFIMFGDPSLDGAEARRQVIERIFTFKQAAAPLKNG